MNKKVNTTKNNVISNSFSDDDQLDIDEASATLEALDAMFDTVPTDNFIKSISQVHGIFAENRIGDWTEGPRNFWDHGTFAKMHSDYEKIAIGTTEKGQQKPHLEIAQHFFDGFDKVQDKYDYQRKIAKEAFASDLKNEMKRIHQQEKKNQYHSSTYQVLLAQQKFEQEYFDYRMEKYEFATNCSPEQYKVWDKTVNESLSAKLIEKANLYNELNPVFKERAETLKNIEREFSKNRFFWKSGPRDFYNNEIEKTIFENNSNTARLDTLRFLGLKYSNLMEIEHRDTLTMAKKMANPSQSIQENKERINELVERTNVLKLNINALSKIINKTSPQETISKLNSAVKHHDKLVEEQEKLRKENIIIKHNKYGINANDKNVMLAQFRFEKAFYNFKLDKQRQIFSNTIENHLLLDKSKKELVDSYEKFNLLRGLKDSKVEVKKTEVKGLAKNVLETEASNLKLAQQKTSFWKEKGLDLEPNMRLFEVNRSIKEFIKENPEIGKPALIEYNALVGKVSTTTTPKTFDLPDIFAPPNPELMAKVYTKEQLNPFGDEFSVSPQIYNNGVVKDKNLVINNILALRKENETEKGKGTSEGSKTLTSEDFEKIRIKNTQKQSKISSTLKQT